MKIWFFEIILVFSCMCVFVSVATPILCRIPICQRANSRTLANNVHILTKQLRKILCSQQHKTERLENYLQIYTFFIACAPHQK